MDWLKLMEWQVRLLWMEMLLVIVLANGKECAPGFFWNSCTKPWSPCILKLGHWRCTQSMPHQQLPSWPGHWCSLHPWQQVVLLDFFPWFPVPQASTCTVLQVMGPDSNLKLPFWLWKGQPWCISAWWRRRCALLRCQMSEEILQFQAYPLHPPRLEAARNSGDGKIERIDFFWRIDVRIVEFWWKLMNHRKFSCHSAGFLQLFDLARSC